jgi:hypothetical protein
MILVLINNMDYNWEKVKLFTLGYNILVAHELSVEYLQVSLKEINLGINIYKY